ncbi:MAG: glycoside hydrolase family 32 protein [Chitinophagaceae bacterium]|nr:glycoside hydrolase family 32 protein [Chitinophagaceae bacterium]
MCGSSFLKIVLLSSCLYACGKKDNGGQGIIEIIKDSSVSLVTLTETDYRPAYHFTPARNWMNDPNGLVYNNGIYHLFYQYNPNASVWGPMNWGHATSTDLMNWKDESIALTPDNLGTIFSGSAVVDANNTTGFKDGTQNPLVAIYTSAGATQQQSIAYSNDGGFSWTKFNTNPVLPNPGIADFRDPKVFWYAASSKWIMVLAVNDRIKIYSSFDLKAWTFESDFGMSYGAHGGVWECPDLFPLTVEGSVTTKWVLLVSLNGGPNGGTATQYFVGDFDGKNFTIPENKTLWMDYGTDNYAGVTYNNIPTSDGRRILIGWMSNWNYAQNVPTTTWRSTMTIPRKLSLANISGNYILKSNPVVEYDQYKANNSDTSATGPLKSISTKDNKIIKTGSYEISFNADLNNSTSFLFALGNLKEKISLNYDKVAQNLVVDRSGAGVDFANLLVQKIYCPFIPKVGKASKFQILVDKTSMEIFVDDGERVITTIFFPKYQYDQLKIEGDGTMSLLSNFSLKGISRTVNR